MSDGTSPLIIHAGDLGDCRASDGGIAMTMPVESRDDLAPCPFCGGTEISFGRLNNAGHLFTICNDCHARASAGESHADASKNWNTRPDAKRIAELEAERAKLRAIISASATAIGNGAMLSPECSIEFMEGLPEEISKYADKLRRFLKCSRDEGGEALERADRAERALAEERERCAQVALSFAKRDIHHYHAIKIATAIRAGKPANGE